jgi:hypothetical protein
MSYPLVQVFLVAGSETTAEHVLMSVTAPSYPLNKKCHAALRTRSPYNKLFADSNYQPGDKDASNPADAPR